MNTFTLNGTNFPLIYGKDASRTNCSQMLAGICWEGCLDPDLVKGKIVVCEKNTGIPGEFNERNFFSSSPISWGEFNHRRAKCGQVLRELHQGPSSDDITK